MYCGPHRNKKPRWVPATVIKLNGTRNVNVRVYPRGPAWRLHVEQLRPQYGAELDKDPPELPTMCNILRQCWTAAISTKTATDMSTSKAVSTSKESPTSRWQ